ncbi:MAG: hypothetical protein IID42_01475, partial [Planctomycetes bacterium]|nr:hypothetical protein [Planctomycetota bacterium]
MIEKLAGGGEVGGDFVESGVGLGDPGAKFGDIGLRIKGIDGDNQIAAAQDSAIGEGLVDFDYPARHQRPQLDLAPGDDGPEEPHFGPDILVLYGHRRHRPRQLPGRL